MSNVIFTFKCARCEETHFGMPSFGTDEPLSYFAVPEQERESRCELNTDECVVDGDSFFIRGCIEIPVHGYTEPFVWGVWVSLSKTSFDSWRTVSGRSKRTEVGPFFGWLNTRLDPYPDTVNLATRVHLRDDGIRPLIELEPTGHPLAIEQRDGISVNRVAELYAMVMHGVSGA